MMAIEEGDILIQHDSGQIDRASPPTVVDRCIDNPKPILLYLLTFCLAMGNAADAVEIMCIGFIMSELELSQTDKGTLVKWNTF